MALKLWWTFTLKIEGDVEEIDVQAETREEAWRLAEEVRADLYAGRGELRITH